MSFPYSYTIVFENEDFAVLNKKRGIPSAPLKKGDVSVLTEFLATREKAAEVVGSKKQVEAGLVHRLDTATSGLILIAKKQKIYDALLLMQHHNLIEKEYIASCDLNPLLVNNTSSGTTCTQHPFLQQTNLNATCKRRRLDTRHDRQKRQPLIKPGLSFQIKSYFLPFGKGGKMVRAIFAPINDLAKNKHKRHLKKEYTTNVTISDCKKNGDVTCICRLTQGFRHQVRCHLSYIGLAIKGDALYNARYIEEHKERIEEEVMMHSYPLELTACKISFPSPYFPLSHTKAKLSFSLPLQDRTSQ